jgi:hypothetical protein
MLAVSAEALEALDAPPVVAGVSGFFSGLFGGGGGKPAPQKPAPQKPAAPAANKGAVPPPPPGAPPLSARLGSLNPDMAQQVRARPPPPPRAPPPRAARPRVAPPPPAPACTVPHHPVGLSRRLGAR